MTGVRGLVGTRNGAFVMTSDNASRTTSDVSGPHFPGWHLCHVAGSAADPNRKGRRTRWFGRTGVVWALVVAASVVLVGCSSSSASRPGAPSSAASSTSIVVAPVLKAHTSLGNVAYRVVGKGEPLVLVMGYAGTMEAWDPRFVDTLARHYRVVVFDNAGLGGTANMSSPLSIDAMADQTAALISSLSLTAPDVLGWSMGSMIAQSLAVRHPSDVGKLVLAASWPGNGAASAPPQTTINKLKSGVPEQVRAVLYPADQPYAYDAYVAGTSTYPGVASPSQSTIASQDKAITDWWAGADPSGRTPASIAAPTLITDGSADELDNVSNSEALAKLIPNSSLQLYPDAGHAFLFQEGTSFTYTIQAFLGGPPAPATTATISSAFLAGQNAVTAAGTTLAANLKSVAASSSTALRTAQADQVYASVVSGFGDQLLDLDATGTVGAAVSAFVSAEEKLLTDVLATSQLSTADSSTWTTRTTADAAASETTNNRLRKALGLPPAPTASPSAA
jgi:pimeloyl-ACP methyl ester carboxylesterase